MIRHINLLALQYGYNVNKHTFIAIVCLIQNNRWVFMVRSVKYDIKLPSRPPSVYMMTGSDWSLRCKASAKCGPLGVVKSTKRK